MSPDTAAALGLRALAFLASEPDALDRLMSQSGLDLDSLRTRAAEPELLSAVLDFLLRNEDQLITFCESDNLDAKAVHLAKHVLDAT